MKLPGVIAIFIACCAASAAAANSNDECARISAAYVRSSAIACPVASYFFAFNPWSGPAEIEGFCAQQAQSCIDFQTEHVPKLYAACGTNPGVDAPLVRATMEQIVHTTCSKNAHGKTCLLDAVRVLENVDRSDADVKDKICTPCFGQLTNALLDSVDIVPFIDPASAQIISLKMGHFCGNGFLAGALPTVEQAAEQAPHPQPVKEACAGHHPIADHEAEEETSEAVAPSTRKSPKKETADEVQEVDGEEDHEDDVDEDEKAEDEMREDEDAPNKSAATFTRLSASLLALSAAVAAFFSI